MKMEKPPVRLQEVLGFAPSDDGRAGIVRLDTSDGPLTLELETRPGMQHLLMALLQLSVACAERRDDIPAMGDSDPAKGVYLPASEVQGLPVVGGHRRLVLRVGVMDLSVFLQTEEATKRLIWSLGD